MLDLENLNTYVGKFHLLIYLLIKIQFVQKYIYLNPSPYIAFG